MIYRLKDWQPEIGEGSYLHDSCVVIGRVKVGKNVSVWPLASIRGDVAEIVIGDNCNIQDCCVLHGNLDVPVVLGGGVTVGHGAVVHGARIGNNCLVGMKAVVMESEIGDNCIIAAGAVINPGKKIPPGSLVMGLPAKIARQLTAEEIKDLHRAGGEYVKLKEFFEAGCSRLC